MRFLRPNLLGLVAGLTLLGPVAARADGVLVNGAGATFPFPLYSKWFAEYGKVHPGEKINYQSIGSGGGIKQITEKTVDFGASDAPMSDADLQKAPGILHIPTVLGAVAIVYSGAPDGLKLSGDVVADIFLGKISKWSDPRLAALNPGVKLPDAAITVAHRADGSGTTSIFTDYLAKVSPAWKTSVGAGKSVKWPVGLGGKGNEGVTGTIKSTPGAIGYVELAYARQNKLATAAIKNADGAFVAPTVEATSAAAAGATLPADFRVSITDAKGKSSYPIAAFTYILVYKDQADTQKGRVVASFLWWAIHDGQKLATALDYAPLPKEVVAKVEATLRSITAQGRSVLAER
jgi:phosphate transport system substrate-binding protein